jgi:hypothetical protein
MKSHLTKKVYSIVWAKDSTRSAEITFDATAPDKFRFSSCCYRGVGKVYDTDDWEFVGELAREVKELCKLEGV